MMFGDVTAAEAFLSRVNYYRLTAYWLPFEESHAQHRFQTGTSFERVLRIYDDDRRLRLLMLDAIERIEVALRTQFAYNVAHHHGPHGYLRPELARDAAILEQDIGRLSTEVNRSKELFVRHMRQTYQEPLPPVWAACEVMSFGLLSSWLGNLRPFTTLDAIARPFGVQRDVLVSWVHHLSQVRNTCAHHSRLWNRSFTITAKAPRSKPASLRGQFVTGVEDGRRLYNTLLLTMHLMRVVSPESRWSERLRTLLEDSGLTLLLMGFPADWRQRDVWRTA